MHKVITALLSVAVLSGCGGARAGEVKVGAGLRAGPMLNGNFSLGLMAYLPVARSLIPLPGMEVLSAGLTLGDVSAGLLSLEHRFGASTQTGGYAGIGLGMMVYDVRYGGQIDLGLKMTLGANVDNRTYVQTDFFMTDPRFVVIGVGRRF